MKRKPLHAFRFSHEDVQIISSERPYQGFLAVEEYCLRHKSFSGGWGPELSRELLIRKDAVAVLLFDPGADALVMVEQIRIGALKDEQTPWMLELVAGLIDTDESREEIARRECQEEAGCTPRNLKLVHSFYLSPGASSERLYLYFAEVDSSQVGGVHGLEKEGEDILVHVIPRNQAMTMLKDGEINNAIAIIGLQWLEQYLYRKKQYRANE